MRHAKRIDTSCRLQQGWGKLVRLHARMEILLIGGFIGTVAVVLVIALGILFLKDRIAPVEPTHHGRSSESTPIDTSSNATSPVVTTPKVSPETR
jgi:hypothetical protein